MSKKRPQDSPKSQIAKFQQLARELETDEDPLHFEETLKKIAKRDRSSGQSGGEEP